MAQKIVFVAGLDYPKDKKNKATGYISKEKQADYLKKGFPTAEVTTFKYNAATAEIKKAVGTDTTTILVLFSAGCAKAKEMAQYFTSKSLPTKNIHLNEPYTCDSGILATINGAIALGVPKGNVYSGGTECTGSNVTGATVLKERAGHNQSQEPLGKLLDQLYPAAPPVNMEKKAENDVTIENPTDQKTGDIKTETTATTNTQQDVDKAKQEEANKVEQEKKVIEDGYDIADGEYTFEFEDEGSMSVVGPNGFTVTWPDGSTTTIGMLYRTGMPSIVPKNSEQKSEESIKQDETSSQDADQISLEDKQEEKIIENINKENDLDEYILAIDMPTSANDRKINGKITFKRKGPFISAVGVVTGFPDGGTITREGEEASSVDRKALAKEMKGILEDAIRNQYNVDIKLTYTNVDFGG